MVGFSPGGGSISHRRGLVHYAPGVAVGLGLASREKTRIHAGPVVNPGPYNRIGTFDFCFG